MEPDDAILDLIRSKDALQSMLMRPNLKSDWVKLLTRIFAIIINSTLQQNVFDIISMLPGSTFITARLLSVIQELPVLSFQDPSTNHEPFINDLLTVFEHFSDSFPSSVPDIPIDNLLSVISRLKFDQKDQTLVKVGELISRRDELIAVKLSELKTAKRGAIFTALGPPPENFRELSVVPTMDDIRTDKPTYLRPIKTLGQYSDAEEYLDVQFRLLKEDFTAPLREGIEEITKAFSRQERKHNMKIYRDVHIIHPTCTSGGITHTVVFDVSRLQHVPWQHSRRLIFGSLLCFSVDNFKSCFFATVSHRDVKELVKGEVQVRFINGLDDIMNSTPDDVYLMAESPSYFEAYRHVLEALQNIKGDKLPFTDYIVSAKSIAKLPQYIRLNVENVQYDLSGCLTEKNIPCKTTLRRIETWEDKSFMNQSQLTAVKKALSREFVIIQGPPGTGKTFVALRITHALIQNQRIWSDGGLFGLINRRVNSNILLVCYTNHALDQFIEGLVPMGHESIVRVGSRCKSEIVDRYSLKHKRYTQIDTLEFTRITSAIGHATGERYDLIQELNTIAASLEMVERSCVSGRILHLETMLPFLPNRLQSWFSNMNDNTLQNDIPFLEMFLGLFPFLPSLTQSLNFENRRLARTHDEPINANGNRRALNYQERNDDLVDADEEFVDIEGEAEALLERWAVGQDDYSPLIMDTPRWEEDQTDDNIPVEIIDEDGFKVVAPSRKERKNNAIRQFKQAQAMTKEQVNSIRDPMGLSMHQRWNLYKYLAYQYRGQIKARFVPASRRYDECCKKIKELDEMKDELHLKDSQIIAMTTTCAARYRRALQRIKPKIIIIEEAAEVLEAHVITSLTEGAEHVILIGDHKQLKPKPTVYKLAKDYNLELSLFERMIRNGMDCHCLDIQHRMRPEIAGLLQDIYPNLQNHSSVLQYPDVKGVSSNLFFISHKHQEGDNSELKSKLNQHEAEYIVSLCWYLLLQGYSPSQITVLTLYTGQLLLLKNMMPKRKFEGVRVTAVDNYQGEENDIVLLSLVRSNDDDKIGFVGIENRICVSLSRAKHGLFVIGDMEFMAKQSATWERIVARASAKDQVGQSLRLFCKNHPETYIDAAKSTDFNAAPEGGCKRKCNYRMKCGHACQKACHPYDEQHLKVKCKKKCEKMVCEENHRCKKLCHYEYECGPCRTLVPKIIPVCNHEQQVPCHQDPVTFSCLQTVKKKLRCDHTKSIPCCRKDQEDFHCEEECKETLECGHICKGTCSGCHQGRLHMQCTKKCKRILVCAHICNESCSEECPPCKKVCQNECEHNKCREKCGESCTPCLERCEWKCQHKTCNMLCSEICDREPCNEPCPKLLECHHPCIGFCGEKCPSLCRVCNKDEVEEIFFGNEDEEDARFVELLDCKHAFESGGLDMWMGLDANGNETCAINIKQCPKCKTPIKKSKRYGNEIKRTMLDIEKVKKAVNDSHNKDVQELRRRFCHSLELLMSYNRMDLAGSRSRARERIKTVLTSMVYGTDYARGISYFHAKPDANLLLEKFPKITENQIAFLERIEKLSRADESKKDRDSTIYLKYIEEILKWCLKEHKSLQQAQDADLELQRLFLYNAVIYTSSRVPARELNENSILSKYLELLRSGARISHGKIKEMHTEIKAICKKYSVDGLTAEEKQMIIEAIKLPAGHWYKCPNGHVYAIGDCGGAMEEGKCAECKETIGGTRHTLAQGNAHAGEFDGSRHAAWSEGANLENFILGEL